MIDYLRQRKWFREMNSSTTYYRDTDGNWDLLENRLPLEVVTEIDNGCGVQAWCENPNCKNELVHSGSFEQEREILSHCGEMLHVDAVYDYKCSCCGLVQHRRPDLMPGLHSCEEDGTPWFSKTGVYGVPRIVESTETPLKGLAFAGDIDGESVVVVAQDYNEANSLLREAARGKEWGITKIPMPVRVIQ